MRTHSFLTVLLWSSVFYVVHMTPSQKRTNKHSHSERITGLSENDGKTLHRTKRGWMWNQFFLLEEYTGPDTQYVGKVSLLQSKLSVKLKFSSRCRYILLTGRNCCNSCQPKEPSRNKSCMLNSMTSHEKIAKYVPVSSSGRRLLHCNNPPQAIYFIDAFLKSADSLLGTRLGTSVIQVTATDADDANYGNSAKVVYSILQGQPYFSVDPETGIIKTALPDMSRENREQYQVVIQAKDMGGQMGGLSGTTTVNITLTDVNDNPPRFPQSSYQFSSPESAPPGTPLGRIKANDPDVGENAEIEYSIFNGDGSDMFDIITDKDTQEGIITVKKHLDFENKVLYTLKVEASNTHPDPRFLQLGPFKDTAFVKISVEDIDEPPVFSRPWYLIEVDEDAKEGSIIGQVVAQDPDIAKNAIKYSVDRHTDLDRIFNIYSGNGSLFLSKPLDREETPWHNITVIATEINNPKQSSQIPVFIRILDINDHAPEFANYYETFVCENAKAGQLIQTVSAIDKDQPPRGHKFFFELVPEFAVHPNFSVVDNKDNTAGIMTRRNGYSRSKTSTYLLPIIIFDNDYPIQSSTGTLTIRVCACDSRGNMQSCSAEALLLPAGLSTGALVAILLCIIILLILIVLFTALKRQRKKEPLIISKDDVRDNIVTYNDEGGGEEDTQAFDIGTLRNPEAREESKMRRDVIPETIFQIRRSTPLWENIDVQDFIHRRLKENDSDPAAPPYDSLATYAYEGNDSIANSLSSLESLTTEGNQDYDYLSDWGPRFKKLADMYGGEDSDRD
ncbi:CADH9 protein, partial [Rhodinocichla rosea]|nr:CADH9 protein [Rhodinocichla rosea]